MAADDRRPRSRKSPRHGARGPRLHDGLDKLQGKLEDLHEHQRRRMGPQAVPRGFLRTYVISLMSRQPETGYSLMRHIDERTDGTWRPGPGTIYPLLKSLSREGIIVALDHAGRQDSVAYSTTEKGKKELAEMQRRIIERGTEGQALMKLAGELFPASDSIQFLIKHYAAEHDLFQEKVMELPETERDIALKQVQAMLEKQLEWIRLQLPQKAR